MASLDMLAANLLSPMLLAFLLGALGVALGTDLRLPDPVHAAISTYLLLSIGFKGGAALAVAPLAQVLPATAAALALGSAIPLWVFWLSRTWLGVAKADAGALAAHYGSVSAVTFVAATAFLDRAGAPYEGFVPALLAASEVPGIVAGLILGRSQRSGLGPALAEVLSGRSVLLLAGGIAIGWAAGPSGLQPVAPLFVALFPGVLTLFLLDMGSIAARRLRELSRLGPKLVLFGTLLPLVHGVLGAALGIGVGMSAGGAMVLATLAASASYIAAPAAVRIGLPEANPSLTLAAVLGVTFPFNLALGLPIYHAVALFLAGARP